jgi:integrase/recombinase XerD
MRTQRATDWRARFLDYLIAERGYSDHTLSAYGPDLAQFSAALAKHDLLSASTDDIRQFILGRLESGASPATVRRKLSTIRSFYQFVHGEGGLICDPSRHIRGPRAFKPVVRPITGAEVDQILAAVGTDHPLDLRNRALVYAAYGSGLRVSEAVNLRIADIDFQHSVAKVRLGKGRKDRIVPLNPPEMEAVRLYLEKARPRFAKEPDSGMLFIGRDGEQPLTRERLWQVFTEISNRVVGRAISPHKYRHAFVTDTINGGAGFRVVQKMAGHANVTTTMRYMHSDLARTRSEYLKSHPRGVEL